MAILGDLFFHAARVGAVVAHHGGTAKLLRSRRVVASAAHRPPEGPTWVET